ncbi:AMP-binding protein [Micromonospora sp. DT233]|uniref:AMP-binding protein n=1 Tax=Micromonospora sp. DT233 TaxID=3393432 RepID=UPI003CEF51A9
MVAPVMPAAALGRPTTPFIGADARALGRLTDWSVLPAGDPQGLRAALPPLTRFTTSGTTGRPVGWWRTREQLVAEATYLCELLDVDQVDMIITQAPVHHLYGFLTGCLVPALGGLPVTHWRTGEPFPVTAGSPLVVTVPASWWAMSRCLPALAGLDRLTMVHSTAYLPPAAAQVCQALPEATLTELHGSTEAGLVGVRRARGARATDPQVPFALAPDVSFAPGMPRDRQAPLAVASPRLAADESGAAPAHHVLDDLVEVTGSRSYRMTGRRTRLVKVNGRRVDLDAVESALRAAVPGTALTCVVVREDVRGEWYDVVVADEAQRRRVAMAVGRVLTAADAPRRVRVDVTREPAGHRDVPLDGGTA